MLVCSGGGSDCTVGVCECSAGGSDCTVGTCELSALGSDKPVRVCVWVDWGESESTVAATYLAMVSAYSGGGGGWLLVAGCEGAGTWVSSTLRGTSV